MRGLVDRLVRPSVSPWPRAPLPKERRRSTDELFDARVTPFVARGAVAAAGVFAVAASTNGHLVNTLHHDRLSDLGEATTLNDNTGEVRRC